MPVTTSIKSYTTGTVPKGGPKRQIQCYVHKIIDTKSFMISDSTGTATLVADKETHVKVIKAKVL